MENLIYRNWIKFKSKNIRVKREKDKLIIENTGDTHGYLVLPQMQKMNLKNLNIIFKGNLIDGNSATFCVHNKNRQCIGEITLNSDSMIDVYPKSKVRFSIKIFGKTKVEITDLYCKEYDEIIDDYLLKDLKNDILVITPSYPTLENKYLCGFVHSRLKAYKASGLKFDVLCVHNYNGCCKYNFEGIDVLRIPFTKLRDILRTKKYSKILVHFFDDKYAPILDSTDLSDTQLYLWVHGPETLYWDWPKFTTGYFVKEPKLSEFQIDLFRNNDEMIKRYNDKENVHWIFVSNWIKNHSEELIGIKFKNYSVIPNIIDSDNFKYQEKDTNLRKKVFFIRRFDNCNKYAIDVNVRTILELSKRECFKDMEFNIYGIGGFYNELVSPLKKFDNVHLYSNFLTHEEIAKVHRKNGIALFATRYDAQGVSMCEAAMSGLAVVTSNNDAVMEFLPRDVAVINETENYVEYADNIEKIYNNPKLFSELSKKCHDTVYEKCNFDETVKKEIELMKQKTSITTNKIKAEKPVLSIIIPSYNERGKIHEKYFKHS